MAVDRSEERRKLILKAALQLFMERGYARTSVDEIVRRAGGSKASVYAYFGSKEGLFRALLAEQSEPVPDPDLGAAEGRRSVPATLHAYGLRLAGALVTRESMRLLGLAVAEAQQFPDIARSYYEVGPANTIARLAEYLADQARQGRLHCEEPERAAEFFHGMVLYWPRLLLFLQVIKRPTHAELEARVREAVRVFMAAYGVDRDHA